MSVTFTGPFTEGQEYVGSNGAVYLYRDGCFVIPRPEDIDTVDGYAEQGIATGSEVDAGGNPIAAGTPIITFYDADGNVASVKDCSDDNDYSLLVTAAADGTDDTGYPYSAGDQLIQLPGGQLVSTRKTVDTDTFSTSIVASAPGTDAAGNPYNAGDTLIQLPGGELFSQAKTIDTDTVDGYAVQGISDGSQLDLAGASIPAGAPIISFYDADGALINSYDLTDQDTFAVSVVAASDGIDSALNPYSAGDRLIQLPGGDVFCMEKAAGGVDTFSTLIVAGADGIDDAGNAYSTGDQLIQLPSGDLVSAEKTPLVEDWNGNPLPINPATGRQVLPEPVCVCPSIRLVKTALPGPYVAGDTVNYQFTVTNDGSVPLTDVTITDNSAIVSGGPITLAAGASDNSTFTATYIYTAADEANEGHVNTAVATGVAPDGTTTSDVAQASVFNLPPESAPGLMLTKTITSTGPYSEGDQIDYSFTVANSGDVDLTNVTVTDPLFTVSGGPISLAPATSDSTTFTGSYVVTTSDVAAGSVLNTATASGNAPDGSTLQDTGSATAQVVDNPALTLTKTITSGAGPYAEGDQVDYSFTVTNTGDSTLTNVLISDPLMTVAGSVTLAPGDSDSTTFTGSYTVTAGDVTAGSVTNTATASGTSPSGQTVNDTDTATASTGATGNPVTQNRGTQTGAVGDTFTFSLSENDTPCSAGTTTYRLTGNNVNVANVTLDDPSTGQYTVEPAASGDVSVEYEMLCDGVPVGTAEDQMIFSAAATADAVTADRGVQILNAGESVSFVLGDNDTVCSSGVTTYQLTGPHVNVASVTLDDASTGAYTVTPAGTGAVVVDYDILCDGVVVDSAQELITCKRCGTLPEIELNKVLTGASNLVTSAAAGQDFNISSTFDFQTPGGTVLASGVSDLQIDDPQYLEIAGTATGVNALIDTENTAPWIGQLVMLTRQPTIPSDTALDVNWSVDVSTSGNPVQDASVNGCPSVFRSEVALFDGDQDDQIWNMQPREWDRILDNSNGGPVLIPPTDLGGGRYQLEPGADLDLYWDSSTRDNAVTFDYAHRGGNGFVLGAKVFVELGVCYEEDAAGNIIAAESFEGTVPSSDLANITRA